MVSSEGVARDSEKTVMLMEKGEGERNLAVQLFMPDADTAKRSIPGVMAYNPAMIDINAGCPVPKVVKTGAGSALLKDPKKIREIVSTIVENTNVPVTIKIRTGCMHACKDTQPTVHANGGLEQAQGFEISFPGEGHHRFRRSFLRPGRCQDA